MKIIFVEPRGVKSNVFSSFMALPLMGSIYLSTILRKRGHDIRVYNENVLKRDVNDSDLRADILCITGLTSTIQRSYKIAQRFKLLNPNSKVIIGGIHASFMKDEAAKYADHVVIGEGESVITNLIENGSKEKFIYAKERTELNKLPLPDFSVLENKKNMKITPIMTSRGCPFACNFCAVTAMYGRQYRTRDNELVMKELRKIKSKYTFFYDDNLCVNHKRSYELFDNMKAESLNLRWSAQVRCDAAKDNLLLKKMSDSGCERVYIGFESVNPKTLNTFEKSQSVDDIKHAINNFQDYGIKVHGMFVLGSDEDTKATFNQTVEFSNKHEINSVQYMVLTPLPGTPTYQTLESEKRLLHKNWKYYDGMHSVFKPKNFSPSDLQQGVLDCYNDFYSYTKAANDSLNLMGDIVTSSMLRMRNYYTTNIKSTIAARYIISRWNKHNNNYMNYLRNIN